MVVQVDFLILHKISPLEIALTEMTLRKLVYLALHKDLSSTYTVITIQILCKLEYGRPFSVFVNLYRKKQILFLFNVKKYSYSCTI
jgi:uncharacterized phage-associated protein